LNEVVGPRRLFAILILLRLIEPSTKMETCDEILETAVLAKYTTAVLALSVSLFTSIIVSHKNQICSSISCGPLLLTYPTRYWFAGKSSHRSRIMVALTSAKE
jgi:hypothetical protein